MYAVLAVSLLAALALACGERRAASPPTNLVIVALDTLRADHLGLYGHARATSPNLDALASRSAVFENARSVSPWTAPALVSVMTSLHPEVHGVYEFPNPARMSDDVTTLAEVLKAAGYETAAFTEGGYAKGAFGLDQGFDVYAANPGDEASHQSNVFFPSRLEANLARTLDWLRAPREQPFFLFFHSYETHFPYRAPEAHIRAFRPDYSVEAERAALAEIVATWDRERRLPPDAWDRLVRDFLHCRLEDAPAVTARDALRARVRARIRAAEAGAGFSPETLDFVGALYDAEIRYTDEVVARLFSALSDLGHDDDTILVVLSDHGEGLGAHGRIQHGTHLHDELTRIPLLLRVPGRGWEGRRVAELVRSLDLMPTLLELLGLADPALPLQGESLVPLLAGDGAGERLAHASAVAVEGGELAQRAVRSDAWLYLGDGVSGQHQLYDLHRDPAERFDVRARERAVAARLHARLTARRGDDAERAAAFARAPSPELDDPTRGELVVLGYLD